MCTGICLIAGVARARLPYAECPVSGTRMPAGACRGVCSARVCVRGALMQRGREGGGSWVCPWVPGGGAWHSGWSETVGRRARDWTQLGGVQSCGRVAVRAVRCLPVVRSRA